MVFLRGEPKKILKCGKMKIHPKFPLVFTVFTSPLACAFQKYSSHFHAKIPEKKSFFRNFPNKYRTLIFVFFSGKKDPFIWPRIRNAIIDNPYQRSLIAKIREKVLLLGKKTKVIVLLLLLLVVFFCSNK
jgi:hypothetical protein